MIKDREFIVKYLKERNYWWDEQRIYDEDVGFIRGEYRPKLINELRYDRILALSGMRRTGKTTLLYQLMRYLLGSNTKTKHIVYIKVDELLDKFEDLRELIALYEEMTGLDAKKEKIYFFLDEIQYKDGWQFQLKHLLDAKYAGKFIITGSSTSLLYKQASESLAGRITFVDVSAFSFRDFVEFSMVEKELKITAMWHEWKETISSNGLKNIEKRYEFLLPYREQMIYRFNEYLNIGGFPEWFKVKRQAGENPELEWKRKLAEYFHIIIHRDVIETFKEKIRDPILIEKVAKEAAFFSSNRFSYSSLANRLDGNKDTVREYLYYLEASGLISISEVYFKSKKAREKIEKKIYFCDEGLRRALTVDYDDGKGVETIVNQHLLHIVRNSKTFGKLWYWKNGGEVDFILENEGRAIPIEVKYQENPEVKGLLECMERFDLKTGIVVTKNKFETRKEGKATIYQIPAWVFLLVF